jgi:riboflavin kinase/FMN adenylyltransferase
MRVIRGLTHIKPLEEGCVLTIGNFDGLHLGHQTVIDKLVKQSQRLGLPVVVLIFEPQPLEYFLGDNAPSRLMRLREKVIQFSQLSIDDLLILPFNRTLADYDANAFIKELLVKRLNVKYLVIGDDFHFGKAREGNFSLLKEKGRQFGFEVKNSQSYLQQGMRISSTLIRDALGVGNLKRAKQMLGRDYSICGRISHGDKRGRTLGFPTANIQMLRRNTPISGVFAITMTGIGQGEIQGIANVGIRPTFKGGSKVILETHLFEFNQEIYGAYVEVHFKDKIRDEMRFESFEQLKTQIKKDVANVKQFFIGTKAKAKAKAND